MKPGQKPRTEAQAARLHATILGGVIRGKTVKEIAGKTGDTQTYIYNLMRSRHGIRKVLLFPAEQQLIAAARARKMAR